MKTDKLIGSEREQSRQLTKSSTNRRIFKLTTEQKMNFYYSDDWKKIKSWASSCYEKRCVACNSVTNIQLDHIKPISTHPEKALDFYNTQYLCESCNKTKSNLGTFKFKKRYISKFKPSRKEYLELLNRWTKHFPLKNLALKKEYASEKQLKFLDYNNIAPKHLPTKFEAMQIINDFNERELERLNYKFEPPYAGAPKTILRKAVKSNS